MNDIRNLALKLKVISEPNRLQIICLLFSGEKCVCQLEDALALSQNLVSHHLKVLKDAGLIDFCKCGKWRHYSLDSKAFAELQSEFTNLMSADSGFIPSPKCNR